MDEARPIRLGGVPSDCCSITGLSSLLSVSLSSASSASQVRKTVNSDVVLSTHCSSHCTVDEARPIRLAGVPSDCCSITGLSSLLSVSLSSASSASQVRKTVISDVVVSTHCSAGEVPGVLSAVNVSTSLRSSMLSQVR